MTSLPQAEQRAVRQRSIRDVPVPTGSHVALAFLGVDHCKDVNDTRPCRRDELMIQLAQRLREHIVPEDMLGRLGGDES